MLPTRPLPAALLLAVVAAAPAADAQESLEVSATASAGTAVLSVAPVLSAGAFLVAGPDGALWVSRVTAAELDALGADARGHTVEADPGSPLPLGPVRPMQ